MSEQGGRLAGYRERRDHFFGHHPHSPLTEEQRARLAEISQRCPVHRTLTGTIRIDDEVRLESPGS